VRFKGDVYSVHLPNPEQSEVTLNDLSVELIEQAARDFHTLKPYIGN
jgi:hypothetical protein